MRKVLYQDTTVMLELIEEGDLKLVLTDKKTSISIEADSLRDLQRKLMNYHELTVDGLAVISANKFTLIAKIDDSYFKKGRK